MSTLKDKLAQSVRQAKSAAAPAAKQPRAAKRVPAAHKPSAAPAAPAASVPAGKGSTAPAQRPAPNAEELFPRRVWPD
jgi:hypothetical protein